MLKKKIRKTITRKELHELVWSKPVMDISKEFGISDRGLGKVCERYDIPKPPRGYWQKLSAGEKIKIPKLPKIKDKWRENIHIEGSIDVQMPDAVSEKIVEHTPEQLVVPARLAITHPLVKETEKTVRKDLRHRRNLILNTLFLELEKYDYEIEKEGDYFKISFDEEHLYLKISEYYKESKRPLTEQEEKKKFYSTQKWTYEYEETGKLKFIKEQQEWIKEKLEIARKQEIKKEIIDENTNFRTEKHYLKFHTHHRECFETKIRDNIINIYYYEGWDITDEFVQKCVRKSIGMALKIEGREYLTQRLEYWSKKNRSEI